MAETTIVPIYWSATKLKGYAACARRFRLEKFVETPEVFDGKQRHEIVERAYVEKDLKRIIEYKKFESLKLENVEIVLKAYERGLLPDPDNVLSCEGRDLPEEFRDNQYGRHLFKVLVEDSWGIRGAADLVFVEPGDEDTLWIADWKSRSQDDGEIQGSCYALAYSIMFPGFKKYVFQQRSLTLSWPPDTYEFLADDMPKVVEFLRTIGFAMEADTTFAPTENKWCPNCRVNQDCPVWIKAATTPIVENLPAVKAFTLPVEFGSLLELKERSSNYEKIAEGLKDRCNKELLKILAHGPQKHDGKIYATGKGTSSYEVKPGCLPQVVETLEKAKAKVEDLFLLDVPRARETIEKAMKKSINNDEQAYFKEALKNLFVPNTYDKIAKKAG